MSTLNQQPMSTQMALLFGGPSSRIAAGEKAIIFDAVESESGVYKSKCTKFPIQDGSYISDHIIIENATYDFTAYISNEPILVDKRNLILYGVEMETLAASGEGVGGGGMYNIYRSKYAHDMLVALWDSKALITVNVAYRTIPNCCITNLTFKETSQNHLQVDMSVEQLRFIEGSVMYVKDTKAKNAASTKDKGKQDTAAGGGGDADKAREDRILKQLEGDSSSLWEKSKNWFFKGSSWAK